METVHRTEAGRSRVGEDAMLVAEGGIEFGRKAPSRVSTSERSPLLDRTSTHSDDEQPVPEWTNGKEWDHLPWYKRPSVCAVLRGISAVIWLIHPRSRFGSYSPSYSPPLRSAASLYPKSTSYWP